MALPRRIPWSSQADYEEVFHLLFSANGDVLMQRRAIDRINVWQSRGSCPHAAEATASILAVILRDAASTGASTSAFPGELRLAYAMAMIRFVNGLVDPAQQGPYARSIAAIAAQMGLPLWFVELRHAATHEDLPSLQVLREAARKAMDWLYAQYWLPQIQSTEGEELNEPEDTVGDAQRTEITALLTQYKKLQKDAIRDASILREKELVKALRAIERWTLDIGTSRSGLDAEDAMASGCHKLAIILCEPGILVPLSKKKRASSRDTALPEEVRSIWEPLLQHFDETFEDFLPALRWTSIERLSAAEQIGAVDNTKIQMRDKSYLHTLKLWTTHLALWEDDNTREQILKYCLLHSNIYTAFVLDDLASKQVGLQPAIKQLQQIKQLPNALIPSATDNEIETALLRMSERITQVQEPKPASLVPRPDQDEQSLLASSSTWSLVPKVDWRPCPFGMMPGGRLSHLVMT